MPPRQYTEAQKNSARKWDAANLDRLSLALPKGKKAEIQAAARQAGESVNQYIAGAINQRMERDKAAREGEQAPNHSESGGLDMANNNNENRPLSLAERWAMDDNIFFTEPDGTEKEVKINQKPKTKRKTKKAATHDEARDCEDAEGEPKLSPADCDRWDTPPGAITFHPKSKNDE